jgi:hypothetical protein
MSTATYGPTFTADTNRERSANLWNQGGGCPIESIRSGRVSGVYFENDYAKVPLPGTQTTEINGFDGLKWFNTGTPKIIGVSTINSVEKAGGFLSVPLDTDNDSGSFGQASPNFFLSGSINTSGKLWFEHRMCFTGILTNGLGWICGLAETDLFTFATAVPLNASDAVTADGGFIGFNKLEDGLGVINTCKADRAAAAPTSIQAAVGSVAAYEFFKLGMFYDPSDATNTIRFFFNGLPCSTVISAATLAAYTYIDANALGFIFASVADSAGTTSVSYHDWTSIYQLLPS